jgi:daunorubicin resistance ABC transporter ATP-binding subunit
MAQAMIDVAGLDKSYGRVTALDGLGFEVPAGSVCALLGPNGSGKTTTVSILSTALRPDAGRASVGGHDVVGEPGAVRAVSGFAGQFAAVDPNLSGRENLTLVGRLSRVPRRQAPWRAAELLDRFGLTDAADRLVRTYSGGMRRRLDVAAALVHRPAVLFLDEPTTGLDPESRFALWATVRELVVAGTTVLLTTQYLEDADALADRVVIIDAGRVVDTGTPADLKARVGAVRFDLGYRDDASAARAAGVLSAAGKTVDHLDAIVRVAAVDGTVALTSVLGRLDADHLPPVSIAIHEPTLDDVFLSLTGRVATDETAARSRPSDLSAQDERGAA